MPDKMTMVPSRWPFILHCLSKPPIMKEYPTSIEVILIRRRTAHLLALIRNMTRWILMPWTVGLEVITQDPHTEVVSTVASQVISEVIAAREKKISGDWTVIT